MTGGGLAPPTAPTYNPTDPFGAAAAATGAASTAATDAATVSNRSNQTNANGDQLTWTKDPTTGQWTQNITQGAGGAALTAGMNSMAPGAVDALKTPLDTNGLTDLFSLNGMKPGGYSQEAQDAIMSRLNPQMDLRRQQMETTLANQGITRGSEAWTNAENQQGRDENDARMQGILGGFQQGNTEFGQGLSLATGTGAQRAGQLGERETIRSQPLQDYLSLQGADKTPQFGQYTTAGTATAPNYLGAAQSNYNAGLDSANLSADQKASLENGLFSLGGSFLNSKVGGNLMSTIGDKIGGLFGFGGG
jgi:hypothetical protein